MFDTIVLEFRVVGTIMVVSMDMCGNLVVFDMHHLERIETGRMSIRKKPSPCVLGTFSYRTTFSSTHLFHGNPESFESDGPTSNAGKEIDYGGGYSWIISILIILFVCLLDFLERFDRLDELLILSLDRIIIRMRLQYIDWN